MTNKSTLLLAKSLAPLTGVGAQGIAARDLAKALGHTGWDVTVVVGIDESTDPSEAGLARRLEPLSVAGSDLVVYEGQLEGGTIPLFAVSAPTRPNPELLLRAATQLASSPDVLQLWAETRAAISVVDEVYGAAAPKTVVHLTQIGGATETIRTQLEKADVLLLSSKAAVAEHAKQKKAPLFELAARMRGLPPGIDEREWNFSRDTALIERIEKPTVESKATEAKKLQEELGLAPAPCPLIAVLGDEVHFPRDIAAMLLELSAQWIGVDAGSQFEAMATRAPSTVANVRTESSTVAKRMRHRAIAAADFVLVPSVPSPLSRLFGCPYGTAVIAKRSGEVADRLVSFDIRTKTGSAFLYREDHELVHAVKQAVSAWNAGEDTRAALLRRAASIDLSWNSVALRFAEVVGRE